MTTQGFGVVHLYEKGYSYALSQWHGDAIDVSSLPDRACWSIDSVRSSSCVDFWGNIYC
ncbi:hypothetical protein [Microcoleus sp. B9-D4]|uniref:hypothetical protein n=1 Tax=Microcoleus sp. B9-D4 TaxID=2818711 RepID=UPI002FD01C4A